MLGSVLTKAIHNVTNADRMLALPYPHLFKGLWSEDERAIVVNHSRQPFSRPIPFVAGEQAAARLPSFGRRHIA
jgi:hypothetical protein